jgi:hypothetical protein
VGTLAVLFKRDFFRRAQSSLSVPGALLLALLRTVTRELQALLVPFFLEQAAALAQVAVRVAVRVVQAV